MFFKYILNYFRVFISYSTSCGSNFLLKLDLSEKCCPSKPHQSNLSNCNRHDGISKVFQCEWIIHDWFILHAALTNLQFYDELFVPLSCLWECVRLALSNSRDKSESLHWEQAYVPGSVAETMAPKNRQSVKKKSPASCPTCFISITQPYISNLTEEQQVVFYIFTNNSWL